MTDHTQATEHAAILGQLADLPSLAKRLPSATHGRSSGYRATTSSTNH